MIKFQLTLTAQSGSFWLSTTESVVGALRGGGGGGSNETESATLQIRQRMVYLDGN